MLFCPIIPSVSMQDEFLAHKAASTFGNADGKTLQEMIAALEVSKVTALKWLRSLERQGLVYRTQLMRTGMKGRPQDVYHPTKNLKRFKECSSNSPIVAIDFSIIRSICRYHKGGMCKALLPKLQRCESMLCPYLKA